MPSRPLPLPVVYVAPDGGTAPVVRGYDAETGAKVFESTPFEPSFSGGVRLGTADFTGDGYPDVAAGAGVGGGPRVRTFDGKSGRPLADFWAFEPDFRGGVSIAAGDVDGDKRPDIVVAAGTGGGPRVRVFSGATGGVLADFFAFADDFRGASVAVADFTGDGKADIVIGAGPGGRPRIRVIDALSGIPIDGPLGDFFAGDAASRGGVNVSTDALAGDVTGDGRADLVVGAGVGQGAEVAVYDGVNGRVVSRFAAFDAVTGGVRVATAFANDDAKADIVATAGSRVRVFSDASGQAVTGPMGAFSPFGEGVGGLNVAATNDPPAGGVVYENTFLLTGPDGDAQVIVTVTKVGEGADSKFHWNYKVDNLSYGWPPGHDIYDALDMWMGFSLVYTAVDNVTEMGSDVYWRPGTYSDYSSAQPYHGGSISWDGYYTDGESDETSDGYHNIVAGESANFWFNTPPCPIVDVFGGLGQTSVYSTAFGLLKGPGPIIQSVTWSQASGDSAASLSDQPAGTPGGGKRLFAEKNLPTDMSTRDEVTIRVQLTQPIGGVTVRGMMRDVDDPSSNNPLLDDETQTEDNRGNRAGLRDEHEWTAVTDNTGVATITLTVTHQPGDNYRAFATVDPTLNLENEVFAKQNDGANAGLYFTADNKAVPNGPAATVESELLTVWRHLYLERDHMGAPPVGEVFDQVEPRKDVDPGGPVRDVGIDLISQQYRPAYIEVMDIGALNVKKTVPWVHMYGYDDLKRALKEPRDAAGAARDVPATDDFWTVQVVSMYEWWERWDLDPPANAPYKFNTTEAWVLGEEMSMPSVLFGNGTPNDPDVPLAAAPATAVVYTEVARDAVSLGSVGVYSWDGATGTWPYTTECPINPAFSLAEVLQRVAYHEVTHAFSIDHKMPEGKKSIHVTAEMLNGVNIGLTADQLKIIRGVLRPGIPAPQNPG